MPKQSRAKLILLIASILIGLTSIIVITKSIAQGTSPAVGIILLSIGVITIVIAMAQKSAGSK